MRAINRPGSQMLGANGRDDGPVVSFIPKFLSILLKDKHKQLFFFLIIIIFSFTSVALLKACMLLYSTAYRTYVLRF